MTDPIDRLRTAGVSIWLDDLSRERLTTGSLAALRDRGVSGVTTNPTIFARAISEGEPGNDHLGAAVLEGPSRDRPAATVRQCAMSGLPRSGTSDELMEAAGISVPRIAAARELVKDSSNGGS